MTDPVLIDLFCGAGGAARGYAEAGFRVIGVDINPQPNFPYEFYQADALEFPLSDAGFVHASPPCQKYTVAQRIQKRDHQDLIAPIREKLQAWGGRWVIENVPGSPLIDPIMLCGAMFPPLMTYRHRLFEANFEIEEPFHPRHIAPNAKMGRQPKEGEWMHIVGKWVNKKRGQQAMGIDWMTNMEMSQSIPPAYTKYIGGYMMKALHGYQG